MFYNIRLSLLFVFSTLLASACSLSQKATKSSETAIRQVLSAQEAAWNRADLDGFMEGYWRSDSLSFIGKSGVNRGWQKTLDNYKRSYPSPEAMGKLNFTILELTTLNANTAYIVGKWHLARPQLATAAKPNNDLEGHFTLLWRKIGGKWCIVSDHSS